MRFSDKKPGPRWSEEMLQKIIRLTCLLLLTLSDARAWALSAPSNELFSLQIEKTEDDGAVVRIAIMQSELRSRFVSDATIYWVSPSGSGMSVQVHPVTDSVLAAQVEGPLPSGTHRLIVSVALRSEQGLIEAFHEREYQLRWPSVVITMKPMRVVSSATHALPESLEKKPAASGPGYPGWALGTFGITLLGFGVIVLLARVGLMPGVEGLLRSSRIGSRVLRPVKLSGRDDIGGAKVNLQSAESAILESATQLVEEAAQSQAAEKVDLETMNF